MRNATNVLLVVSFLWLLVSFWNRNELPGSIDYVAGITTRTAVCIALLMIISTCNVKTRDQAAWESFDMHQLSNNHLISDDDFIISRAVSVLPQALQVASALTRMVEQECYDC